MGGTKNCSGEESCPKSVDGNNSANLESDIDLHLTTTQSTDSNPDLNVDTTTEATKNVIK